MDLNGFEKVRKHEELFEVEKEVWVRFGYSDDEEMKKRYMFVKENEKVAGWFEKIVVKDDKKIVSIVDDEKKTRYLCFVNKDVLKQVELAVKIMKDEFNVDKPVFPIALVYNGLKQGLTKDGKKIKYHDIDVYFKRELHAVALSKNVVIDEEDVEF